MKPQTAVVVTGAATGIGAATVIALAGNGTVVFAGVRNDSDRKRLADGNPNIRPVWLDVTDASSIAAAAEMVRAAGIPLRGLVNNAGIVVAGPLEFVSEAELRTQFDVNVLGPIVVTQAFLPQLRESRGRVVLLGSISGRIAIPFIAPYSASKFALRALADALRIELEPDGIAVALVEPGSVKTPIWRKGRHQYQSVWSSLPPRYQHATRALLERSERAERSGIPVEAVTRAITDALYSKHPRPNYMVGVSARLSGMLVPLLPTRWRDNLLRRAMRLGGRK